MASPGWRLRDRVGERHAVHARPALLRAARPRPLDQNLAHRAGRDAEEVPPVGPRRARAGQLEKGLVHERRRLKRLTGTLATHIGASQAPQLVVDERHHFAG